MADGMTPDARILLIDAVGAEKNAKAKAPRPAQRDMVIGAVLAARIEFWRDGDGVAFATVPAGAGCGPQRFRVKGDPFRRLVRGLYGEAGQRVLSDGTMIPGSIADKAMAEVLPALEAMAQRGAVREPAVRVCQWQGATWLDLGRPDWSLVRITGDGWRVLDGADVPLVRPANLAALPVPARGAAGAGLKALAEMLNVRPGWDNKPGDDFLLMVAWLVATLHPAGPYPVLALDGEQGSGKSTACRMLRRLVDPNKSDLRAPPRDEGDLLVAATAARVVALDNVSFIEPEIADALCRVATGGGLSKRLLYSDGDEHLMHVCRPVLLNGIPSLLGRADLADRALAITLAAIPDHARKAEADVWAAFDREAPVVLAALLDGLACAMKDGPGLHLPRLPRMADFARLACAAAGAFGWTTDAMLNAIERNRAGAVQAVIEADPVAVAVRELLSKQFGRQWEGTATALLNALAGLVPLDVQRERGYPKDAARLSMRLRRVAPALRRDGVDIVLPNGGGREGRTITITGATREDQRSQRSQAFRDTDTPLVEVAEQGDNDGEGGEI